MKTLFRDYNFYKKNIEEIIILCLHGRKFTIGQSLECAYEEVVFEKFLDERIMPYTILAKKAIEYNDMSVFDKEEGLLKDIVEYYAKGEHLSMAKRLDSEQKNAFLQDVKMVFDTLAGC